MIIDLVTTVKDAIKLLTIDSLEWFLYIIPILEIILIHLFFKPFIKYQPYFKFSVTDIVMPILLVGIHVLSVRLLTYSLLPIFLFFNFLLGFSLLFYFDIKKKKISNGKIFSLFLKVSFLAGFLLHYGLVFIRIAQVLEI